MLVRLLTIVLLVTAVGAPAAGAGVRIDPADFANRIDNPWFPLLPGTTYVYRGVSDGKPLRDVFTVTRRTKTILGVRCVVVKDNVYVDGRLAEPTSDWFAQDTQGNVWYFGEATAELDRSGHVTSTKGSWQAGVDGAQPGIVMPARPRAGASFRQEYYKGEAEDHFEILSLSAHVSTPYVSSSRAMLTKEWTPLEPGVTERKYYVRGVGLVSDPTDRSVLVSVRKP